jgi:hypothetical protein
MAMGAAVSVVTLLLLAVQEKASDSRPNLEMARQALQTGKPIGRISLEALNFGRELDIGSGLRVLAISRSLGGGLAAFGQDGSNIGMIETGEFLWIQLFDLNEDGTAEVVTEEVDGRGTGVLTKVFRLYVVSTGSIKKAWEAESFVRTAPWRPDARTVTLTEKRAFLRFDASGAGQPARMTYAVADPAQRRLLERVFEMKGDAVQPRQEASR